MPGKINKILLLSVMIFIVTIVGCQQQTKSKSDGITVGILQHGSAIPLVVAKEDHIFEKHGLNVTFKRLDPKDHMPALLRGDVQVLSASSFPVILSTAQQNPKAIVAYMTGGEALNGDAIYGIVVQKESKASSLKDLVGKKIGSASKFTIVNLRNVLGIIGDHNAKTNIKEVSDKATLIDLLRKGIVDAVVLDQPALSSEEVLKEFKIIETNFRAKYLVKGNYPYWSGSGVVSRVWVEKNQKQFEAFLQALDEALLVCKNDPGRVKRTFISHFDIKGLDPDRIGMYVYPSAKFAPPLDFIKTLGADLVSNGMLSSGADFSDLFYR